MNADPRCALGVLAILSLVTTPDVSAQIYRCETPGGPVFADKPCGTAAELVTLERASEGISGGPPESVREYLAEKRRERAEERDARIAAARAARPSTAPATQVIVERPVAYPGFWGPHLGLRPPHDRPPRPGRPTPGPASGGSVLKPRSD